MTTTTTTTTTAEAETHSHVQRDEEQPREELESSSSDPYYDAIRAEAASEREPGQDDEALEEGVYPRNSRHMEMYRKLKKMMEPKETVFVGNMFFDVTAEDVRQRMQKFGVVQQVYIVRDNRGISKGWVSSHPSYFGFSFTSANGVLD